MAVESESLSSLISLSMTPSRQRLCRNLFFVSLNSFQGLLVHWFLLDAEIEDPESSSGPGSA